MDPHSIAGLDAMKTFKHLKENNPGLDDLPAAILTLADVLEHSLRTNKWMDIIAEFVDRRSEK
jgi:hypothetical protein